MAAEAEKRDPLHAGEYDDQGGTIYIWSGDCLIATVSDEDIGKDDCEARAAFIVPST